MTPSDRINLYTIRLEGHLDPRWLRDFENQEITLLPDGETLIQGLLDQSALYGLLGRIGDLGVALVSIQRQPSQDEGNGSEPERKYT